MKTQETTKRKASGSLLLCLLSSAILVSVTGCQSVPGPYEFSSRYRRYEREPPPRFDATRPQIELGRPMKLVDNIGHYFFSAPGKLILWDTRVGNHKISEENVELLRRYLCANDLDLVKVRVNQYAPWAEFKRLWRNSEVSPFYRATFGLGSWGVYTLFPGRLFAGFPYPHDHYNPFTNTVNLYSDHPALMVQQASRAKDWAARRYKGTYAVLGLIPGVDLYQEQLATGDTIRYFYAFRRKEKEVSSYRVLYPAFGTHFGQLAVAVGPIPAAIQAGVALPGAVAGHIIGRAQARKRLNTEDPVIGSEWAVLSPSQKDTP